MPYDDYSAIPAAPGIPDAPQQQMSLPALLSAIGGLGLNVAGLATGTGAHGAGALSLSEQLQQQADRKQSQDYRQEVRKTQRQQTQNIGKALSARLGEISNPDAAKEIQTAIDNGNLNFAQGRFQNEISEQHRLESEARVDKKLQDADRNAYLRQLDEQIKGAHEGAKDVQKNLHPEALRKSLEQEVFAGSKNYFQSAEDLKQAYNAAAKKNGLPLLGEKGRDELWNRYTSASPGVVDKVTALFSKKPLPTPAEAFKNYADNQLTPEEKAALKASHDQLLSHQQTIDQARQLKQMLLNPKTRDQAMQIMGSGTSLEGVAPPARGAAGAAPPPAPKVGDVQDGHRFKGGNPADPKNWEKVK